MLKRLIDTTARELTSYNKAELLTAISDSEGRTLAAETIGTVTPMLVNITNAEFVASLGADLIMLNIFDVNNPIIQGLPQTSPEDTIREVKRLTGRMVAINLEPAVIKDWAGRIRMESDNRPSGYGRECKKSCRHGRGYDCSDRKSGSWRR